MEAIEVGQRWQGASGTLWTVTYVGPEMVEMRNGDVHLYERGDHVRRDFTRVAPWVDADGKRPAIPEPQSVTVNFNKPALPEPMSTAWTDLMRRVDAEISKAILGPDYSNADVGTLHEIAPPPDAPKTIEFRRAPWVFVDLDGTTHTLRSGSASPAGFRCPKCSAPAVQMLVGVICEREGGCIGSPEERVAKRTEPAPVYRPGSIDGPRGESYWYVPDTSEFTDRGDTIIPTQVHPTRDGVLALWREAALAAERAR